MKWMSPRSGSQGDKHYHTSLDCYLINDVSKMVPVSERTIEWHSASECDHCKNYL